MLSDGDLDVAPRLVELFKDVIHVLAALAAEEADQRRRILIDRDHTAPFEQDVSMEDADASVTTPRAGPRRIRPLDRNRAARRRLEEGEQDDRGLLVHEEFVQHLELVKRVDKESRVILEKQLVRLQRARDLLDRESTLGVLRLLAHWTVTHHDITAQALKERSAVARVSRDRRLIEDEEATARCVIASYRDAVFAGLLRSGYTERDALQPAQDAFVAMLREEQARQTVASVRVMREAHEVHQRLDVERDESDQRRSIRNMERVAFTDITRLAVASMGRILGGKKQRWAAASVVGSPTAPTSASGFAGA